MSFYKVNTKRIKSNNSEYTHRIGVDFVFGDDLDIICKGGDMFAFWHGGKWNTSKYDLMKVVDSEVNKQLDKIITKQPEASVQTMYMKNNNSKVMRDFKEYTKLCQQSDIQFNSKILFADEVMLKEHYATTQLSYSPSPGDTPAFNELLELLYGPEDVEKIMWFMGALLTNNMHRIQKFLYLYGGKGTGKGTVIKIFKMLFEDYYQPIDLNNLTSDSDFATSEIKEVPLLIDDDTDLSRIAKDTNLLKLTAHEPIVINSKYKTTYVSKFEGLLITASNQRFRVRNIDSGITRRAVVAEPTNMTHKPRVYDKLMKRIKYELPTISYSAIELFKEKGPHYYEDYVDYGMIEATDYFFSFVRENAVALGDQCTLKQASELYKLYLEDSGFDIKGYKQKAKLELQRYYQKLIGSKKVNGETLRNVFEGFKWDLVFPEKKASGDVATIVTEESMLEKLNIVPQLGIFDEIAQDYPAQLTTETGTPKAKWDDVKTTLKDINPTKLHYVRLPLNHIVIDFDIKDGDTKSLLLNLKAIESFPPTYTELSKSGRGIHLHYIYKGDVTKLDDHMEDNVEIKVFKGKSSLRRMLTKCNDLEIATISSGLPIKEEKLEVYKDIELIKLNEQKMRTMVKGNLEKKYHKYTRPSIDFIVKIFEDAQKDNVLYDLRDMRQSILRFAMGSNNQASYCIRAISKIEFNTLKPEHSMDLQTTSGIIPKEDLYFYDLEVYPNLFVVCYKKYTDKKMTELINPTPMQIETMLKHPLVGFNNRRYDNHIIYSALLGADNNELFVQSQRIINKKDGGNGMFAAAYELSYTDIYDYSSAANKKSLKKWQLELGIHHEEMELPWDKPVEKGLWGKVVGYCGNDVDASIATFDATESDYKARGVLSAISGLSMNATTNAHTTRIVFEGAKDTSKDLVYTDLSTIFPGYTYSYGKSEYKGEDPKEGGYVYAEPGVYSNVMLLDVASMHPYSIIAMNAFGKYTKNFADLVQARIYIKHDDYKSAGEMFDGKLKPFLTDKESAKDLSNALKTAINSAYGLTSAKFDNPFRHPKNKDNIVAKRGALFMIDLKNAVQEQGYTVIHIKTDSIKIQDGDDKIKDFIFKFGKKYDYTFEHEATYDRLALINKSTYACLDKDPKKGWSATGTQFINPYVFKRLFTKETIEKEDLVVAKEVKDAAIYLGETFVGRFSSLYASKNGQDAYRVVDDKQSYLTGTKGYKWKQASDYTDKEDVDFTYYESLVQDAIDAINKVGSAERFLEDPLF